MPVLSTNVSAFGRFASSCSGGFAPVDVIVDVGGRESAFTGSAFDVAAKTIEGTPPGPQTVILKFESTEAAKAWYESPEYQAVVGKRLAATKGFAILAQSMNFRA